MGSSQSLSNGNEVQEVTALLLAFEHMNKVQIQFGLHTRMRSDKRELRATLACWPDSLAGGVLTPSDYKSVQCWANDYKSLMALVTGLLYKLDFELGESEWAKVKPKP